jgi:hypothetical protein
MTTYKIVGVRRDKRTGEVTRGPYSVGLDGPFTREEALRVLAKCPRWPDILRTERLCYQIDEIAVRS